MSGPRQPEPVDWYGFIQANVEAHIAQAAYWAQQLHEEANGVDLQASVLGARVDSYDLVLKRGGHALGGFGK